MATGTPSAAWILTRRKQMLSAGTSGFQREYTDSVIRIH